MEMDPGDRPPQPHRGWPLSSLALVAGLLVATSLVIVLMTAPFVDLMGPGAMALGSAAHGVSAFVYLVTATIGLYLAWQLFTGRLKACPDLQLVATVMASLSLVTVVMGNWIYIAYRAKGPGSPRSYFLASMPAVHKIFFEFKEYTALFTLPLAVAAAFIVWRYGARVVERGWMRVGVSLLVALHFFYFVVAFGLGAAVTKLKGV